MQVFLFRQGTAILNLKSVGQKKLEISGRWANNLTNNTIYLNNHFLLGNAYKNKYIFYSAILTEFDQTYILISRFSTFYIGLKTVILGIRKSSNNFSVKRFLAFKN